MNLNKTLVINQKIKYHKIELHKKSQLKIYCIKSYVRLFHRSCWHSPHAIESKSNIKKSK